MGITIFSDITIVTVSVLLLLDPGGGSPCSDRLLSLQAQQWPAQCARGPETWSEDRAGNRLVASH